MAQENFNLSTPDDGLGDALRNAFQKQQNMNTELYATKVDKVTGKDLSTNDFTNALKAKLDGIENFAEVNVQADWLQDDITADDYIKNKPTFLNNIPNSFVNAEVELDGQDFKVSQAEWYINGQQFQLPIVFPPLTFALPLAATGLQRFDLFYGTNTGFISRLAGIEAEIAVEPTLPPNSVRLTVILTNDTGSQPPAPIDINGFVQKIFASFDKWATEEITLSLDGKTNFIANTALASFKGFNFPSPNDNFYEGKPFILFNNSGSDIVVEEDSADVDLPFLNGYTHENGKLILFVPVLGKLHMVGSAGGNFIPLSGTAEGSPVTGDIELQGSGSDLSIFSKGGDDMQRQAILFGDSGFSLQSFNSGNTEVKELAFGFGRSLEGSENYSEVDPTNLNIYAQRQYVVDKIAEAIIGGGASFLDLTDTPASYTGQEGKVVIVNATADGLEFGTASGGGGNWGSITGDLEDQTDLWSALASKLETVDTDDIENHAVTNTKLAQMNASTVKGRLSGNGTPQDIAMVDLPISTATQTALNAKIDKTAIQITKSTNFNASGETWNGSYVELNIGANNITLTINVATNVAIRKIGTGTLTIVSGIGRTLINLNTVNQLSGNYSLCLIESIGTNDILNINDNPDLNFLKLSNVRTSTALISSFTGTPRKATVTISPALPDTSYNVQPEFGSFESAWRVENKTVSSFDFLLNQSTAPTADINFLIFKI